MLDLGGGAGTYAIAFCQTQPELSAVIFDLPGPLTLAYKLVSAAGLTDRSAWSWVISVPRPCRAVLTGAPLQHPARPERGNNQRILTEVFATLEPGGELILRDVLMNEDRTSPVFGALFAVNLVLHSPAGRCYTYSEVSSWLAAAGFHDLEVLETNAVLRASK